MPFSQLDAIPQGQRCLLFLFHIVYPPCAQSNAWHTEVTQVFVNYKVTSFTDTQLLILIASEAMVIVMNLS